MTFDPLLPFYRLTLALHVIAVIPWVVGVLTVPRLYVEHAVFRERPRHGALFWGRAAARFHWSQGNVGRPVPEGEGGSARTEHDGHTESELSYTSVQ